MRRNILASRFQAWIFGIGSAFDLSGGASDLVDRDQSDWSNLGEDWRAVGRDLEWSMKRAETGGTTKSEAQLSLAL